MIKRKRIVRREAPRLTIGDRYSYRDFKEPTLTVVCESPRPGYQGHYHYLMEAQKHDGTITYLSICAKDVFVKNSIFIKVD